MTQLQGGIDMQSNPISRSILSKNKPHRLLKKSFILPLLGCLFFAGTAFAQITEWVSKDSDGNESDGFSVELSVSGDGRFVAFVSSATNLVPDDTNEVRDVFLHDRETSETTRLSVDSEGKEADNTSRGPSISADGRYVAFASTATNLVHDDTNGVSDVFVYDRKMGETSRVSVDSEGNEADSHSLQYTGRPSISGDGRFVAFHSWATNLVPNDTNGVEDVFVHDRETGVTTRVSVDSFGDEANLPGCDYDVYGYVNFSTMPSISADGRYVAFVSCAADLVTDDTNDDEDIFVHDRETGKTTRVSVDSEGNEVNGYDSYPSISGDGRNVAFISSSSNYVPDDTNRTSDVFVHDRETGKTTRVSVDSGGNEANSHSEWPSISADGRFVAFLSNATNLIPNDTNEESDIFLHDRESGETIRVSVGTNHQQANDLSWRSDISSDGRYIAFSSSATNLVPGDIYFKVPGAEVFLHGPLALEPLEVTIDIAPRRDPNRIRPERGRPAVAILTDESFDATQVNPESVHFGPAEAVQMNHRTIDVDSDGDVDQVFYFLMEYTGIACGDTEATLTGETFESLAISGTDTIITVGCRNALAE
jgi:Tol biopolymer transport system component